MIPRKNPFVSVIVPNYNYARFLHQRMESILTQTYQNFEVILLDDCSTDNSKDIIEQYRSNKHVSHIVYNETNSGSTFKQWYRGFELAKGELIWIAESDDYAAPDFLEKLVKPFTQYPNIVMSYSGLNEVDVNGNIDEYATKIHCHNKPSDRNYYTGVDFIKDRMTFYCSVCNASAVVFDKHTALDLSKDYTKFKAAGDYFFWILLAERGNVIKCDEHLDYFRRHTACVTPNSVRNGIAPIEEFKIHQYLWKKHYLSGLSGLKIYLMKYESFLGMKEMNTDIKQNVLKTWDPHGILNNGPVRSLCWKIISLLGK